MKMDQRTVWYRLAFTKPQLNTGKKTIRLAFLSDLHNCEWDPGNEKLLERIDNLRPDLVLCGGDMLLAHPGETSEVAVSFMQKLAQRHRVYYAMGNHEYRLKIYPETYGNAYREYMDALQDSDIVFLDNASARVTVKGVPVCIYGLSIERKYYRRLSREPLADDYIAEKIGLPDPDAVNILLAHTPRFLKEYMDWGADLTLSGHYHGGIMRTLLGRGLISPDPGLFPYNANGGFTREGQAAVISAGMGEHTVNVRINNPRELVAIRMRIDDGKENKKPDSGQ